MSGQPGFFDVEDRLKRLRDLGDHLEAFAAAVEFELFRPALDAAVAYADASKGGRPLLGPVMMFKILVIQATNGLSDERAEFLINDRLSPHPELVEGHALSRPVAGRAGARRAYDLAVPGTSDASRDLGQTCDRGAVCPL